MHADVRAHVAVPVRCQMIGEIFLGVPFFEDVDPAGIEGVERPGVMDAALFGVGPGDMVAGAGHRLFDLVGVKLHDAGDDYGHCCVLLHVDCDQDGRTPGSGKARRYTSFTA